MGRTVTPKYRVETRDNGSTVRPGFTQTPIAWDGRKDGRANKTNLERWVRYYNLSFAPGGTNFQVSKKLGFILHNNHAALVEQRTGLVVAVYSAPPFEVVDYSTQRKD